jgi:hypothetical protein
VVSDGVRASRAAFVRSVMHHTDMSSSSTLEVLVTLTAVF